MTAASSLFLPWSFGARQALAPIFTLYQVASFNVARTLESRGSEYRCYVGVMRVTSSPVSANARVVNPPTSGHVKCSHYSPVGRSPSHHGGYYCQGLSRCHIDPEFGYLAEKAGVHPPIGEGGWGRQKKENKQRIGPYDKQCRAPGQLPMSPDAASNMQNRISRRASVYFLWLQRLHLPFADLWGGCSLVLRVDVVVGLQ